MSVWIFVGRPFALSSVLPVALYFFLLRLFSLLSVLPASFSRTIRCNNQRLPTNNFEQNYSLATRETPLLKVASGKRPLSSTHVPLIWTEKTFCAWPTDRRLIYALAIMKMLCGMRNVVSKSRAPMPKDTSGKQVRTSLSPCTRILCASCLEPFHSMTHHFGFESVIGIAYWGWQLPCMP